MVHNDKIKKNDKNKRKRQKKRKREREKCRKCGMGENKTVQAVFYFFMNPHVVVQ